jgi:FkbM family methyltransferase
MNHKISSLEGAVLHIKLIIVRRISSIVIGGNRRVLQALGFNSADLQLSHLRQLNILKPFLTNKDVVVVDGGANVGDFAKTVLRFNPNARLICIEPQPGLASYLRKTFAEYKVVIVEKAISTLKGKITLYLDFDGDRKASTERVRSTRAEIVVDSDTVAHIIQDLKINHVDILKLDLEGADGESIIQLLQESIIRPEIIIIEVSFLSSFFGVRPREIHSQLTHHRYSRIFRTSPLFGLIPLEFKNLSDYEGHTTNWIALRDNEYH